MDSKTTKASSGEARSITMLPCAFFHADSNLELVDEWFLLLSEGALNTAVVEELLRAD